MIKKRSLLFIAVFCIGSLPLLCKAQGCKDNFLGSKTLYQPQQQKYSPVPKGYQPVFINHVGRHGSRHLTKAVNSYYLYQLLLQADSLNELTANGKILKEKLLRLETVEKQHVKSISLQGKKEQQGLADRMYSNNSTIFNTANPVLHVAYTKEIRTLQTSEAFLNEFNTKIHTPTVTQQINDTTLRFYDLSPAYSEFEESGDWMASLQQLKTALQYDVLASQVTRYFFSASFIKNLSAKYQEKVTTDLFGFIAIFYSVQEEIIAAGIRPADVDMRPFLNCSQLSVLAAIDNAEDFLQKGPGTNSNAIQVKIAAPLLADFIRTTDDFIATKAINAQLRFSHAETIAPYAALLGLTTATTATNTTTAIKKLWDAGKVIPLSANIQWIVYQKKGGKNYLIKFLLNEKEVAVKGLVTKNFPFYNWADVRAFYLARLQQCNAGLDTDYPQYLKEVK